MEQRRRAGGAPLPVGSGTVQVAVTAIRVKGAQNPLPRPGISVGRRRLSLQRTKGQRNSRSVSGCGCSGGRAWPSHALGKRRVRWPCILLRSPACQRLPLYSVFVPATATAAIHLGRAGAFLLAGAPRIPASDGVASPTSAAVHLPVGAQPAAPMYEDLFALPPPPPSGLCRRVHVCSLLASPEIAGCCSTFPKEGCHSNCE